MQGTLMSRSTVVLVLAVVAGMSARVSAASPAIAGDEGWDAGRTGVAWALRTRVFPASMGYQSIGNAGKPLSAREAMPPPNSRWSE